MEISSNTILKSLLGSIVHYAKCIQVEQRIDSDKAKAIAYRNINEELTRLLELPEQDNFVQSLDKLIKLYRDKNEDIYTLLLQIKQLYRERKS